MGTRLDLSKYTVADPLKSSLQVVGTLAPMAALWALTAVLVERGDWWWSLLLVVPSVGLRTRAMLLQHDAGHHALFSEPRVNDALGHLLGLVTWAPYLYWRRTHAMHHVNSSRLEGRDELGSITTLTVDEYLDLPPGRRLAYRLSRNPWLFCVLGGLFQFVVKHRYPWDMPGDWRREWRSVHLTNLSSAALWIGLALVFSPMTVLLVEGPILVLSAAAAVWLIFIQHVFEGGFFARAGGWSLDDASLRGSSFYRLPALLEWCTASVGYHHVHHFAPRIPNYRLREAFLAHPELHVEPLTLVESLRCWDLKLWDERAGAFVGFPDESRAPAREAPPA